MEPPMQKQRHGTGVDSAGAPAPSVEVWGVFLSEHKGVFFGEYCRNQATTGKARVRMDFIDTRQS